MGWKASRLLGRLCLAFFLAGSICGNARAQRAFVVSINHCKEVSAGEPARAMRSQLIRRSGLDVLSEEETAQAMGGASSGSIEDAERLAQAAHLDLIEGNFARADRTLTTAETLFRRLQPSEDRWVSYRDALTTHVWVNLRLQQRERAATEARELLAVEPNFLPTEKIYPPAVTKFFVSVRTKLRQEPKFALSVFNDADVTVYVGLRPLGKGSIDFQLPAGTYQVEGGFEARGLPHQVRVDGPTQLTLTKGLEGSVWPDRGPCFETGTDRSVRLRLLTQLASRANAQRAVAMEIEELAPGDRYLIASAVDASTGAESSAARIRLRGEIGLQAAAERLAGFIVTGQAVEPVQVVRAATGAASADGSPVTPRVQPAAPIPPPAQHPLTSEGVHAHAEEPGGDSLPVHPGLRVATYVTGGLAATALGVGIYQSVRMKSALREFDDAYPAAKSNDPSAKKSASYAWARAQGASQAATISYAVAGGSAMATVVMAILSRGSSVTPSVAVGDGHASLELAGRF